jgi:hypothetical protein
MSDIPFLAYETVPLDAGTSSSSVTFSLPASRDNCLEVMITNEGTATAFLAFGSGSATATLPGTTGTMDATPILAGETMVLRKDRADTCAAITRSDTATLYFTAGKGN